MKNIVFILALMVLFLSCFLIFQPEIENNPKADLSEKLKSPKDSVLTSGRRTAIRRIKVNRSSLRVREELLSYYQSIMTNEKRMHIRDDIIIGIMCRMVSYDPFQALEIANDIEDKKRRENVKKEVVKYLANTDPSQALEIANDIEDKSERKWATIGVAVTFVNTDLPQALEVANGIEDKGSRGWARGLIVNSLANTDPSKALEIANDIESIYESAPKSS